MIKKQLICKIMKKVFMRLTFMFICFFVVTTIKAQTIEAESMTLGGPYAGTISSPFSGVALYANGDYAEQTISLPTIPGEYEFAVRGASNNNTTAGVSLEINDVEVASFSFSTTSAGIKAKNISFESGSSTKTIKLILKTDNGSNDTYIDWIKVTYIGTPPPPRPAPVIPTLGAVESGVYRNMFVEAGYEDSAVTAWVEQIWSQLFYGDDATERLYYPVNGDEAYILDVSNDDVRSEGMSYGMMICVQLDKQEEFNRLWKWAKTHSQHQSGPRKGYFAWQCSKSGEKRDNNPASDGEVYFVTALYFASARWGNGTGIFNYEAEANFILNEAMSKENPIQESVTNLFNTDEKQIVFVPYATAAEFTDPSYHIPSFFEVWSVMADNNQLFWEEVAQTSRSFFPTTANAITGLMPDYAEFDGTPNNTGNHGDFRFDSWRCIMNMAMDYAWYKKASVEYDLIKKQLVFFHNEGVSSYGNQYAINGTKLSQDHSPGLVATNAVGALASDMTIAWDFIDELYDTQIPSGRYRYYDGLLYMMSVMHLSGNFKAYLKEDGITASHLFENATNKVFPSPTTGVLYCEDSTSKTQWKIYDLNGRLLLSQYGLQLDISSFAEGTYILHLNGNPQVVIKK